MSRTVRAALTQTRNVFPDMPDRVEALDPLAGRLEEIRCANVDHHVALIAEAKRRGAQVVGLGELFPAPYFALEERAFWRGLAEDALEGPTVRALSEVARREGVVLVAPVYEADASSGRRFNTAVVIDADGRALGRYRKTHIPCGTNERARFVETTYYDASDGRNCPPDAPGVTAASPFFPVFRTAVGRLGVAICYDRHFEGVMRSLAAGGAEIVFSPAVTFGEKSRRMWELEFPVDAARHGLYIGGSNRLGREPPWNVDYFGASYFAGPNGRLDDRSDHPNLAIADLDLATLAGPDPSGWDLRRDQRPGIYAPGGRGTAGGGS